MITYKIRDKEKNKYIDDMIADSEGNAFGIHKNGYGVDCLAFADQSRYTIEHEISDDVIDNIVGDYNANLKYEFEKGDILWNMNEQLKQSIRKYINK